MLKANAILLLTAETRLLSGCSSDFQRETLIAVGLIVVVFSFYSTLVYSVWHLSKSGSLHGLSSQEMIVRLAQQAYTIVCRLEYSQSSCFDHQAGGD